MVEIKNTIKRCFCANEYEEYIIAQNILYWCNIPEFPAHFKKCKDCSACNLVEYERRNKGNETYKVKRYERWGVKEPFEIKDTNQYCTEY